MLRVFVFVLFGKIRPIKYLSKQRKNMNFAQM